MALVNGTVRRKNWFFNITKTVAELGTRLLDGDRPIEQTFRDLLESTTNKSESEDRAKEDDGSALSQIQGLGVAATDLQAKSREAKAPDRTRFVQPSQLPSISDQGESSIILADNEYFVNYEDKVLNIEEDVNVLTRTSYLASITTTFTTWIASTLSTLTTLLRQLRSDVNTNTSEIAIIQSSIDNILGGSIDITEITPVGSILPFAGVSTPSSKWLFCDGSEVEIATYPSLAARLSTRFNIGGETVGFVRLPNTRDLMLYGAGALTVGTIGGVNTELIASNQIPKHRHIIPAVNTTPAGEHIHSVLNVFPEEIDANGGGGNPGVTVQPSLSIPTSLEPNHIHSVPQSLTEEQYAESQVAFDKRSKFLTINYIIKAL